MSLIINCEWYPPAEIALEARFSEMSSLLADDAIVALTGASWHRLGRSKADAKRRAVSPGTLVDRATWKTRRYSPEECDYTLALWNSQDEPQGASLLVDVHDPPQLADTLSLDGQDIEHLAAMTPWTTVLDCARAIASKLGGMCIVSSHELIKRVETSGGRGADLAAYAAFWGRDRSARNPAFANLDTHEPHAVLCASDWSQVKAPDLSCILDLIAKFRGEA